MSILNWLSSRFPQANLLTTRRIAVIACLIAITQISLAVVVAAYCFDFSFRTLRFKDRDRSNDPDYLGLNLQETLSRHDDLALQSSAIITLKNCIVEPRLCIVDKISDSEDILEVVYMTKRKGRLTIYYRSQSGIWISFFCTYLPDETAY